VLTTLDIVSPNTPHITHIDIGIPSLALARFDSDT
jgi:hypothetical protein